MNTYERINDPAYQTVLGDMIDDFFRNAGNLELRHIFRDEAALDMAMVMIHYFSDKADVDKSLTTLFALGVYLANKNEAILPSNIQ